MAGPYGVSDGYGGRRRWRLQLRGWHQDQHLRRRDLENDENPYNTYQVAGLPPGPIASPGLDALEAVVDPEDSDYLYFVSRNDGTHVFSRTYREHVNAVNHYQRRRSR